MENLLLPSKVEYREGETPNKGEVVITPCYYGYGTTLGNVLRRIMLSSLPGAAVEHFKIKGVQHEFTTIEGVQEDVVEIILNLKQLIVKVHSDEPVVLNLVKKGIGPVTAKDIEKDANVEVINKDLVIANLTSNRVLEMEITVGRGRGFKVVEQKDRQNADLGTVIVDSIYNPMKDVGYSVELTRVGDITNYEKLILNIETDGTITPREAVLQSTKILMDHLNVVLDGEESMFALKEEKVEEVENEEKEDEEEKDEEEKAEEEKAEEVEDEEKDEEKPKKKAKTTKTKEKKEVKTKKKK